MSTNLMILVAGFVVFVIEAVWHRSLIAAGLACWVFAVYLYGGGLR